MHNLYKTELQSVGLSSKEASIYTVLLALGPSSVQHIARKANVARGTTYVVLESLIQQGLVSLQKARKRRLFVAERPDRLLGMLEKKRITIDEDITAIRQLLPELRAVMRTQEQRPFVRYYEGKEGLRAIRQEMVMYSQPGDVWHNLAPIDALVRVFGVEEIACVARVKKGITSRTIGFTSSDLIHQTLMEKSSGESCERKFFPCAASEVNCGLTIFRDRVAVGYFYGDLGGMIIESSSFAALLMHFFELTWKTL